MKQKKILLIVSVVMTVLFTMLNFSCSSSNEQVDINHVKSYVLSLNENVDDISVILVSDKYVANPDSIAIKNYVEQIKDTSAYGMEQKMWLLMGSEIYFSSFWNKGKITGKQIDNIKRVSAQYKELEIKPESYAIFSIVKYTDLYGRNHTSQLAFLLNDNDSIITHKEVEPCNELLKLFNDDDISQVID